ncbi:hypothetical protein GIY23_04700 [Allosaccharopolyspora coralli]|uniref:Uncharacterized protein n=1 Tax=Allosaccharopolyspora coralli TaxID=2665642 RepID=A0A5Q3Q524_9PSEU|nr:hypothetical protein GIY23_04700 [Allosaccharopolyspora coralli]
MVLILLVLAAVGGAVAGVVLLPHVRTSASGTESVETVAVVVESTPCGTNGNGDLVEVDVNGQPQRVRFDGCGHTVGTEITVWLSPGQDDVTARPVGAAAPASDQGNLRTRVTWVLFTLACSAGAGFAALLGANRRVS